MISFLENNKVKRIPNLVKWVGGKNSLYKVLRENIPIEFSTYFEPFFGGGTLFWNLKNEGKIKKAIISDVDPSLVNLLNVVHRKPYELATEMQKYKDISDKRNYYKIRSDFNNLLKVHADPVREAAIFLYLNRNCFNGLWRTNKMGEFNVPYGKYNKYHPPPLDEILYYSTLLENTEILREDYKFILSKIKKGDFVYLDPPYIRTKNTQFIQYNYNTFSDNELNELENTVQLLNKNGAFVLLTNRYCDAITKKFQGFRSKVIVNSWPVNRNGKNRKGQMEILMKNY